MQWSQIKTLFILCFLILDVFLLFQFVKNQQEADYDVLRKEVETTIQDNLHAENIEITADLPDGDIKGTYISVQQHIFSEKEMDTVQAAENQETAVIDKKLVVSKLKKPIPLAKDASEKEIETVVKTNLNLISPEKYVLWEWNKDYQVLIFFQEKKKRPIYFNQNGMLLVFINSKNEISSYAQTLLGEKKSEQNKESLIKPIKAISVLYQKNELNTDEEVTKVDIGYHTRIPVENGTQIFAPTWRITVDNERTYFVNAIEGLINSVDVVKFLKDSLPTMAGNINNIDDNQDLKKYFSNLLRQRIDKLAQINRGEIE